MGKRLGIAAGFAAMTVLLGGALGSPAAAGFGPSMYCDDGLSANEQQILRSPVSLGIEHTVDPSGVSYLLICYSTTPYGAPGGLTGGALQVALSADGSVPSGGVGVRCLPDIGIVVGPTCDIAAGFALSPGDVPTVSAPPTGICLVNVDGSCVAYAPGLRFTMGQDGRSTALLTLFGIPASVDIPARCVAVLAAC